MSHTISADIGCTYLGAVYSFLVAVIVTSTFSPLIDYPYINISELPFFLSPYDKTIFSMFLGVTSSFIFGLSSIFVITMSLGYWNFLSSSLVIILFFHLALCITLTTYNSQIFEEFNYGLYDYRNNVSSKTPSDLETILTLQKLYNNNTDCFYYNINNNINSLYCHVDEKHKINFFSSIKINNMSNFFVNQSMYDNIQYLSNGESMILNFTNIYFNGTNTNILETMSDGNLNFIDNIKFDNLGYYYNGLISILSSGYEYDYYLKLKFYPVYFLIIGIVILIATLPIDFFNQERNTYSQIARNDEGLFLFGYQLHMKHLNWHNIYNMLFTIGIFMYLMFYLTEFLSMRESIDFYKDSFCDNTNSILTMSIIIFFGFTNLYNHALDFSLASSRPILNTGEYPIGNIGYYLFQLLYGCLLFVKIENDKTICNHNSFLENRSLPENYKFIKRNDVTSYIYDSFVRETKVWDLYKCEKQCKHPEMLNTTLTYDFFIKKDDYYSFKKEHDMSLIHEFIANLCLMILIKYGVDILIIFFMVIKNNGKGITIYIFLSFFVFICNFLAYFYVFSKYFKFLQGY